MSPPTDRSVSQYGREWFGLDSGCEIEADNEGQLEAFGYNPGGVENFLDQYRNSIPRRG